jgi:hypothetical protein
MRYSLGTIVGRRTVAVGDEDEQMPPDLLDDALQLDAGRVRRRASHGSFFSDRRGGGQ